MAVTAETMKTRSQTQQTQREFYEYPLQKPGQKVLELYQIKEVRDPSKFEEKYDYTKVRVLFRQLVDGASTAKKNKDQEKMLQRGHGKVFYKDFNPVISPPRPNKQNGTTKPSALYSFLSVAYNGGDDLTEEQLENAIDLLNDLETQRAQFDTSIKQHTMKNGTKINVISEFYGRLDADDMLPPFAQFLDERTTEDDESVVCTVTGEVIHGFEVTIDGEKTWWDNEMWSEKQSEVFGEGFLYEHEGKHYPPPFGPKHYRFAKEQKQAQPVISSGDEEVEDEDTEVAPF